MENITSTAELQVAIQLLEAEQAVKLTLMKQQFHMAYESLKPVNLIESTLKDIASSPILVNNILVTFVGLISGYLSQKAVAGKSGTKIRKLFGYILQFGVTNLIARNPTTVKSFGNYIFQHIFHKKEINQPE